MSPVAGNATMFVLLSLLYVLHEPFLRSEVVNMLVATSWFVLPAFCRKFPLWGLLAGFAVIELLVIIPQGTADLSRDLPGMTLFAGITVGSFLIGKLLRHASLRRRLRRMS